MQALFRLLFEEFNLLFFDFIVRCFLFLASEVVDFEPMWYAPRYLANALSKSSIKRSTSFSILLSYLSYIMLSMYKANKGVVVVVVDTRCYIITFVIIEAVMAAQSSFEGGGTGGAVRRYFWRGVLSKLLLDNSSF